MGVLTDDMKRIVQEQRLGFVATVCADGTPNLSPKGTTAVWDDDHLVFADIRSPNTVAEINVVDPVARTGYRFKGTATIHTEGALFEDGCRFYAAMGVSNPIRAIVLVKVERALPLISPVYDTGATEETVRERWLRHWRELWGD